MKSECKKIVDSILKNTQYNPINKTGFEYDVTNMFFHPCELKIGVYYLIATKAFSFIHLGHIFKNTFGTLTKKESKEKTAGHVSPWEAVCIAVGGCVGTGNVSGVAAAIALGGPGALFWIWAWAFFGMTIKCVEVSLASYYRSRNEDGEYFGGPSYYMEKGLGQDKKWKVGIVLAWVFGICFFVQWFIGSQAFAVSEVLKASLNIPQIPFVLVYSAFLFYVLNKGVPRLAKTLSSLVPIMCILYVVAGLGLIFINIDALPGVMKAVFTEAFTGSAAAGGFAGASIQTVMRAGVSRSINSNEAGQGTSPAIHASADTVHPVRQGLWSTMEVFVDTIVICTITSLAILCSGTWNSGLTSGTLTVAAFDSAYGQVGIIFLGIMMALFGFTTTGGAYTYYYTLLNHVLRNCRWRKQIVKIYTWIYSGPNIIITSLIVLTGSSPALFWTLTDITIAFPVFTNLLALFLLRDKYKALLKDYKSKYMGIGEIDESFKEFYDTEPCDEVKEYAKRLIQEAQAQKEAKA